jgi:hypothetical protein
MNELAPLIASNAPAVVAAAGPRASYRFLEFFIAQIRNPHTRRAYARAAGKFFDWLAAKGVTQLAAIETVHVATYIEQLQRARSAPTAKLRLAALRHLFNWMVIGQIMPANPAAAVRGPRHIVRRGKTPVLDPAEARQLLDAIDTTTVIGLRDRALISLMVNSFARIGAAIGVRASIRHLPWSLEATSPRSAPSSPGTSGMNCGWVITARPAPKGTQPIASARRCRRRCSVRWFRWSDAPRAAARRAGCSRSGGCCGPPS